MTTIQEEKKTRFYYDIGFSFASDARPFVRRTAGRLMQRTRDIFFDEFHEGNLWGADLLTELPARYGACKYVALLLSEKYLKKPWTIYERREILFEFLKRRDAHYVLPIRYNGFSSPVPGLSPSIVFLDASDGDEARIAELIEGKIYSTS